jgi:hypothetical protein
MFFFLKQLNEIPILNSNCGLYFLVKHTTLQIKIFAILQVILVLSRQRRKLETVGKIFLGFIQSEEKKWQR